MAQPSPEIRERLQKLQKAYLARLPERLDEIASLLARLQDDPADAGILEIFHRAVHSLRGTSASFGLRPLSDAAEGLERHLRGLLDGRLKSDAHSLAEIAARHAALVEATRGLAATAPDISFPELPNVLQERADGSAMGDIFIVEDDVSLRQNLSLQIGQFGYRIHAFGSSEEFLEASRRTRPSACIVDVALPEGSLAGAEAMETVQRESPRHVPVIFLSSRADLGARLQAVRSGSDSYFVKPVNITTLVEKLDSLIATSQPDPFRILIVDDEPEIAAYHAAVLEQAGMTTRMVHHPLEVYQPLVDFNPDLILMDMYMPACDGSILAKTIRQIEAYFSIPIVFLSSETDVDRQFSAISTGGDDFLTKPIRPEHLVSSVAARAQRMRLIRSFMQSDSLTGLLNHTQTKESLDRELIRAARYQAPLAFAMIDIDHFKAVNDTYGHAVGDRVIVGLTRLLRQRLRRTDIIGRYGGDEFAAILVDSSGENAARMLEDIRGGFSQIRHLHEAGDFGVTFSCGIAEFPPHVEPAFLADAADKALYAAKHGGRNRVVLSRS